MKKGIFSFLLLAIFTMSIQNVSALEISDNIQLEDASKEILIQNKIDEFLETVNKEDVHSLTVQEETALVEYIENFKQTLYDDTARANSSSWDYANTINIGGYIFVSMDSRTSSWTHGHAGIGYSAGGNVIEANPGDGVKLYTNRVNNYWSECQTGGIYKVNGASSSKYNTARDYAYERIGRGYGFDPIGGDFYCSELVYYAWDAAGYNIASSRIWGTPILPSQLMNDGDTILQVSFPF